MCFPFLIRLLSRYLNAKSMRSILLLVTTLHFQLTDICFRTLFYYFIPFSPHFCVFNNSLAAGEAIIAMPCELCDQHNHCARDNPTPSLLLRSLTLALWHRPKLYRIVCPSCAQPLGVSFSEGLRVPFILGLQSFKLQVQVQVLSSLWLVLSGKCRFLFLDLMRLDTLLTRNRRAAIDSTIVSGIAAETLKRPQSSYLCIQSGSPYHSCWLGL